MPPGLRRSSRPSKPVVVNADDDMSSSESSIASSSSPSKSSSKKTVGKQTAGRSVVDTTGTSKQQRGKRKRPLVEKDVQDEVTTVTNSTHSTAASTCDPIPRKRVTRSRSTTRTSTTDGSGGVRKKNSRSTTSNNNDSIDKKKTGEAGKCTTARSLDEKKSSPPVVVTSNYFTPTVETEGKKKPRMPSKKQQLPPQVKPAVVNNAIEPKKRATKKVRSSAPSTAASIDIEPHSSSDDDEWEEVEPAIGSESDADNQLHREEKDILLNSVANGLESNKVSPDDSLEIEVDRATGKKSVAKKQVDPWEVNRRKINAQKKANQVRAHKVHLLCFIGCGLHMNSLTYLPEIQGLSLSIVDFVFKKIPTKFDVKTIGTLITDFTSAFKYSPLTADCEVKQEKDDDKKKKKAAGRKKITAGDDTHDENTQAIVVNIVDRLSDCLSSRTAKSNLEYILAFISLLRIMRLKMKKNLHVRLCLGLNPVTVHPFNLIPPKTKAKVEADVCPPPPAKIKKGKKNLNRTLSSSDESDYEVTCTSMTKAKTKIPHRKEKAEKITASKTRAPKDKDKVTFAAWIEIKSTDGRWIPVYVTEKIIIDDPQAIIKQVNVHPLYVYAFDDKSYLKDVTARYAPDYLEPSFRKNRADNKWLEQTIPKFTDPTPGEDDEIYEIQIKLSEKPMPNSISGFKNHPFFILKRHLLAYETIFPNDAEPVSFFKDEPVYDRNNVRPVHTRDFYRREARVVKEGEEAYKFTKGKKKWSRGLKMYVDDPPRELFGEWQTEPYDPPTAENGIVPRNEFNNVELFKPCMLPKGCVHMRVPGLLRVAKKLNIDCVPAVTGFDNVKGSGGVVPIMDGFVVCEEFEDILLEAFNEEQVNARKREESRRIARVNANWRRLTRALIIRERLREKYDDCA